MLCRSLPRSSFFHVIDTGNSIKYVILISVICIFQQSSNYIGAFSHIICRGVYWQVNRSLHCCCCQPITDDDVDRIATCIRVLADQSPLMFHVFNDMCRQSLSMMLSVKADEEKEYQKVCGLVSMFHFPMQPPLIVGNDIAPHYTTLLQQYDTNLVICHSSSQCHWFSRLPELSLYRALTLNVTG